MQIVRTKSSSVHFALQMKFYYKNEAGQKQKNQQTKQQQQQNVQSFQMITFLRS